MKGYSLTTFQANTNDIINRQTFALNGQVNSIGLSQPYRVVSLQVYNPSTNSGDTITIRFKAVTGAPAPLNVDTDFTLAKGDTITFDAGPDGVLNQDIQIITHPTDAVDHATITVTVAHTTLKPIIV